MPTFISSIYVAKFWRVNCAKTRNYDIISNMSNQESNKNLRFVESAEPMLTDNDTFHLVTWPNTTQEAIADAVDGDSWYKQAQCAELNANYMYPKDRHEEQQAKNICHNCPVIKQCLDQSIRGREIYGIWGGMNPQERQRLYVPKNRIK